MENFSPGQVAYLRSSIKATNVYEVVIVSTTMCHSMDTKGVLHKFPVVTYRYAGTQSHGTCEPDAILSDPPANARILRLGSGPHPRARTSR